MTHKSDFDFIALIPIALAVAFMLWVLWNFTRERRL
jgi:hypothetical protein